MGLANGGTKAIIAAPVAPAIALLANRRLE